MRNYLHNVKNLYDLCNDLSSIKALSLILNTLSLAFGNVAAFQTDAFGPAAATITSSTSGLSMNTFTLFKNMHNDDNKRQ